MKYIPIREYYIRFHPKQQQQQQNSNSSKCIGNQWRLERGRERERKKRTYSNIVSMVIDSVLCGINKWTEFIVGALWSVRKWDIKSGQTTNSAEHIFIVDNESLHLMGPLVLCCRFTIFALFRPFVLFFNINLFERRLCRFYAIFYSVSVSFVSCFFFPLFLLLLILFHSFFSIFFCFIESTM